MTSMSYNEIRRNKVSCIFLIQAAMTPCYTAPELFSEDGVYSYKTELWAIGCILYELASGQVPFFDESVAKLINKIINEDINFHKREFNNFSSEFTDLLRRLLEKVYLCLKGDQDHNKRIGWNELVKHNFWENPFPETTFDRSSSEITSPSQRPESSDSRLQSGELFS